MSDLKDKKIFNPEGNDSLENRKLVGGESTNLFNLNNTKYTWANKLYRGMMDNFWIPEKVNLNNDKVDYEKLTKEEQRAYNGILSFLVFLDSIQTNNLPNISDFITAPEVNLVLSVQAYQEAVHSQSYAYIIESIIPKDARNQIYDFWRKDKKLFQRNEYIAGIYQKFADNKTLENFAEVIIADYVLEAIYFYNGFNFFYNLASRNLMIGTKDIINYINRDEATHVALFDQLIRTLKREHPGLITNEKIVEMMKEGVKHEIEWGHHIIGDNILGMSPKSIEQHTYWLANSRLKKLGIKEAFPEVKENPFAHLKKIANEGDSADSKGNYFESTVTAYNQSTVLKGWEEF